MLSYCSALSLTLTRKKNDPRRPLPDFFDVNVQVIQGGGEIFSSELCSFEKASRASNY